LTEIENPLVSVLMTAYNRENYIGEAIESVINSSYQNWELIIVDDSSKDNTVGVSNSYAARDGRIKVYKNEINLGDYVNRNKVASYATGVYLKYLDSDDLIFPWSLSVMVACMEKYPDAAMGVSQNAGNIIYPKILTPQEIYRLYFYKNLILSAGPTGTIIRRKDFERYGGFSGKKYVGDTELWLQIAKLNKMVLIPPGQIYWREHSGQQISEERQDFNIEALRQTLNEKFLNEKDCPLFFNEGQAIIRNLRNIKCRRIIETMTRGEFGKAMDRKNSLALTWRDFVASIQKNKIPNDFS